MKLAVNHLAVSDDNQHLFPKTEWFEPKSFWFSTYFLIFAGELLQGHVLVEFSGSFESPPEHLAVGKAVVDSDDLLAQIFGLLGLVVHSQGQGHSFSAVLVD